MPTANVELDRRFRPVSTDDARRPDRLFGSVFGGSLGWADLLAMRRVVILAEAGSGKSHEFKSRWSALADAGGLACYAAVQDVARSGLDAALGPKDLARLATWREGDSSPCWLFVDSVDEAKDEGLSFATALRNLAVAISGREERAHVLISGRFSDWDFGADRDALEEWLAVPTAPPPLEAEDHRDLVRATLSRRKPPDPPRREADGPASVVLMSPLDESRVRRFATGAGIGDADAFVAAVELGNLWRFASRPLDLDWMTAYWRDHGELGSLSAMLDASVRARLLDPKPARQRRDPLSVDVGLRGLERVGAGLHFTGRETLRLPSADIVGSTAASVAIEALLPDWPRDQQLRLVSRPVFDPATQGRVRIHNDNEGAVRAYLAARWLRERLASNCPTQVVDDLLFANVYGHALIRPDMLDVAAWLSLWFPAIADEVISRDPYLLLTRGDPGSLPVATRIRAIEASLADRSSHDPWFVVGEDMFRRLLDPAFDPLIPVWWDRFAGNRDARHLLLRLIWLGRQSGGRTIAARAAFDGTLDATSQALAGFALIEVGDDDERRRLADHVVDNATRLPRDVVLGVLDRLFPRYAGVDRLLAVIDAIGVENEDGTHGVYPLASELPPGFADVDELTTFVAGMVDRIGPLSGDAETAGGAFAEALAGPATAAALRLLDLLPDTVPPVVTRLVLRLRDRQADRGLGGDEQRLAAAIVASPSRRRASLWSAAVELRSHPWFVDADPPNIWQIQHLGWSARLGLDDVDWLLADVRGRADPCERMLALEAAHSVWRETKARGLLARIRDAAASAPELREAYDRWRSPPAQAPEIRASTRRLREMQLRNERRTRRRDQSWVDFVDRLRVDPSVLDRLQPQTDTTVDGRLYHLWELWSWRVPSRARRSGGDLDALEPVVGSDVATRFGAALIRFAEARTPRIPSDGPAGEPASYSSFDTMGLSGIALAAATRPAWARTLTDTAADQAARYAVVELNGLPDFATALAEARPRQLAAVLNAEIDAQLAAPRPDGHGMLDRIANADPAIAALVAPHLRTTLTLNRVADGLLPKVVNVLVRADFPADAVFDRLVRDRAATAPAPEVAAQYLALLFSFDGDGAVAVLRARMRDLDRAAWTLLCGTLLPRLAGNRFRRDEAVPMDLSFAALESLVVLAQDGIRPDDDVHRPGGEAYSPGWRDHAQDARQALFSRLADTPGEATHAALLRLAELSGFPIEPDWLLELARRRAVGDAHLDPWRPEDLVQFETEFDRPPSTTADLRRLAVRRIEAIEHDLTDGRFTQGTTLRDLPDENAVQRWLGDRLELMQGNVYAVDRETHVVGEKEPDITLRSRSSGVVLPIEIKLVDGMSVAELERALISQLCGQYLRHRSSRDGILLLVHQRPRPGGWRLEGSPDLVPLGTVLTHLRAKAETIRTATPDGPQPVVACMDVSRVPLLRRGSPD